MIAALFLAQAVITGAAPTTEAYPATEWNCNFTGADGAAFFLKGVFAEAPVGSDPNASFPTQVEGNGPAHLVGPQRVNALYSYPEVRTYQIASYAKDGSNYVTTFSFMEGERIGLATVTRYVPDPATKRGTLSAFATGHCRAVFHPVSGAPRK
jgi:hypothetical protein